MLDTAEAHLQAGRVAHAIEAFRALLTADPNNGLLRGRVAEAYRRAGNVERAFHHFNKAAALCVRANDLVGALRMFDAANQMSPNEPEVLFRWAECIEQLGDVQAMRPLLWQLVASADAPGDRRRLWALERLTALEPQSVDLAVAHAAALSEAGRLRESVQAWQRLSAALGRAAQPAPRDTAEQAPHWVQLLLRTAERASGYPEHGAVLAHILIANRRPRQALSLLVSFYDQYPDDVDILSAAVAALEGMQAWDQALAARLELLDAHVVRQERGPALDAVAQLLRVHATEPAVLRACADACKSFALHDEASRLRFQLCQLHQRQGDLGARDRLLFELLQDAPQHEAALALAVSVLNAAGRADEARRLAAQLAEVQGGRPRGPSDVWAEVSPEPPQTPGHPTPDAVLRPEYIVSVEARTQTRPVRPSLTDDLALEPLPAPARAGAPEAGGGWDEVSALVLGDEDVLFSQTDLGVRGSSGRHPLFEDPGPTAPPAFDDEATVGRGPAPQARTWVPLEPPGSFEDPLQADANPTLNAARQTSLAPEEATTIEEPETDENTERPHLTVATALEEDTLQPAASHEFADEPPTRIDMRLLSRVPGTQPVKKA